MPPRAVTFPLGPAARDAALRHLHLPAKPNRSPLQRLYGLLYKRLAKALAPEGGGSSGGHENPEPLALGCALLLLALWRCFEARERGADAAEDAPGTGDRESGADDNVDAAGDEADATAAAAAAGSDDPYFLLRHLATDYARLVRLLSGPGPAPAPPSLLVVARALRAHGLEAGGPGEALPKWMRVHAAASVRAGEEAEGDDEDMDEDENDGDTEVKKTDEKRKDSAATSALLRFLCQTLDGLIDGTATLMSSYCIDFGPLWDRIASSGLDASLWGRHMQQLVASEPPDATAQTSLALVGESARSEAQVLMQLQKIAWKLSCYRAHVLHSELRRGLPTRQERLLATCGALSFLTAIDMMMTVSSGESTGNTEPSSKRAKKEEMIKVIRDTATETTNFSRWTPDGTDGAKLDIELSVEDIQKEMAALAKTVFSLAVRGSPLPSNDSVDFADRIHERWVKDLLQLMPKHVDPQRSIYSLPSCADLLFNATLESLKGKEFDPKNFLFLNEADLVELDSLDAIVEGSDEFHNQIDKSHSEELKITSPGGTSRRVVTPPVLTNNMELNEWTVSLLYLETIRPSKELRKLLDEGCKASGEKWSNVILPCLNRVLFRLVQENMVEKSSRIAPVVVDSETGAVDVSGDSTPEKQLCAAVVALYYHSLEAILYCESIRLADRSHTKLISNTSFHKSLLACCIICVIKAIGVSQKIRPGTTLQNIQLYSVLPITETTAYDVLKVTETFIRSLTAPTARGKLGSPLVFALPKILVQEIKRAEILIIDSLLWATEKKNPDTMIEKIEDFQEKTEKDSSVCFWPPRVLVPSPNEPSEYDCMDTQKLTYPSPEDDDYADYRCVNYLLRRVLTVADERIQALCSFLGIPSHLPVAHQVWVALRFIVRRHVDLLYDRHIDQWILCCLYGVCKAMKYDRSMTFGRIIDAYVVVRGPELGDVTCQRIVRHIKIMDGAQQPVGDIIYLYNQFFLWKVHKHLLRSDSILSAAKQLENLRKPPSKAGSIHVELNAPDHHLQRIQSNLRGLTDEPMTQTVMEVGKQ